MIFINFAIIKDELHSQNISPMWLLILIIVAVYAIFLSPVQKSLNKMIKNRKLYFLANFLLAIVVFLILLYLCEYFKIDF